MLQPYILFILQYKKYKSRKTKTTWWSTTNIILSVTYIYYYSFTSIHSSLHNTTILFYLTITELRSLHIFLVLLFYYNLCFMYKKYTKKWRSLLFKGLLELISAQAAIVAWVGPDWVKTLCWGQHQHQRKPPLLMIWFVVKLKANKLKKNE